MSKYFKLLRVSHYIKNILVFVALAFSGQLFDFSKLKIAVFGFISFCLVSSCVYIINDIVDKEKDSKHPTKSKRPIASGVVSIKTAVAILVCLLLISLCISAIALRNTVAVVLLILYLLLNIAYSLKLKNIPIIDVAILVSGFLLRILFGAVLTSIDVSNWLYLTVLSLSFFLALGKRRNELQDNGDGETREVLKYYNRGFLEKNMYVFLTMAIVFYSLWAVDANTVQACGRYVIFTVPLVILITLKYSLDIESSYDGDPVEVLLHDKMMILFVAVYILAMLLLLYL